jgi:pyruvate kinase
MFSKFCWKTALAKLRQAGMNIVRMNFSHGTHEYHGSIIDNTRKSYDVLPGRKVAIALDTKGPEIRTGTLAEPEVTYEQDQEFILTTDESRKNNGDKQTLYCDYKELCLSVQVGQKIFVADGSLTLIVLEKDPASVFLKVKAFNTAKIGSKKNMNLPMCEIHLPALSEQDKKDLEFGVERDIDMVFASFVRKAADVREIRKVLGEKGKHIKIISKIENHEGIENYESILAESDGIMVARGDLGMEIAPSKIFLAQKMMIARANLVGKPIICATQMLESMIKNPRPTRAEVTDVANAVLDGADCVMLSGETANGDFPNECVTMMHDICCEAEQAVWNDRLFHELVKLTPQPTPTTETIAAAAVNASFQQPNMAAIVVLSTSGSSAAAVSKYRPRCPIICVTRSERTARACHLNRGVISVFYPEPPCADDAKWQVRFDFVLFCWFPFWFS